MIIVKGKHGVTLSDEGDYCFISIILDDGG